MQVVHAQRAQMPDASGDSRKRAGEAVDIGRVAQHALAHEPIRLPFAGGIECRQCLVPRTGEAAQPAAQIAQPRPEIRTLAVERVQRRDQRRAGRRETPFGAGLAAGADRRQEGLPRRGEQVGRHGGGRRLSRDRHRR
jgi:hypothetical protein